MANLGFYKTSREDEATGAKRYTVRLVTYSVIDKQAVVDLAREAYQSSRPSRSFSR